MTLAARFQSRAAAAPAGRPVQTRRRSKYAGVSAAQTRHPMPNPGKYKFEVVETTELTNPRSGETFRATCKVLESEGVGANAPGDLVVFLQSTSGPSEGPGTARVKRFVMAACNLEDEGAYDAFDPEGLFLDACAGIASEGVEADPLRGRIFYAEIVLGKEDGRGGNYREWSCFGADDSEQTQPGAGA